ncbi:MAG: hypothetical protein IT370_24625 [Deltaproteobacteria bacterium]|nr:hypothetical protein [Deltaproteobacteria bacterium]
MRAAPAGVHEAAPAGATWPNDAIPVERFATERDVDFLDRVMRWVDQLRGYLMALPIGRELDHDGVDLFEVARYHLTLALAPVFRRWEIAAALARQHSSVWWSVPARPAGRLLASLHAAVAPAALHLAVQRLPDPRQLGRELYVQSGKVAFDPSFPTNGLRRAVDLDTARGSVVFSEYFAPSALGLIGVARELEQRHGLRVTWLSARREVATTLAKAGVPSLRLEQFASPHSTRAAVLGWTRRRRLRQAVLGLPAQLLPFPTGDAAPRRVIADALVNAIAEATRWLASFGAALHALQPSALVSTTYSSVPGRAAATVTRGLGAAAVYVQHGLVPDRYVYAHFLHDLNCMWGDYEVSALGAHGVDPNSLFVTGAVIYDALIERARAPRPSREGLRIGFLASLTGGDYSPPEVCRRTLAAVGRLSDQLPHVTITVKAHPGDRTQVPEESLAPFPKVRLVRTGTSQDVVLDSDLVIVIASTTGFEACVAGRPLIVFNLTGEKTPVEYVGLGAALEVREAEALAPTIVALLESPERLAALAQGRHRLLEKMLAGAQGGATQRVAGLIAEAAARGTSRSK